MPRESGASSNRKRGVYWIALPSRAMTAVLVSRDKPGHDGVKIEGAKFGEKTQC
jgi:hypothetical protein